MSGRNKPSKRNDAAKESGSSNKGKNCQKKSPNFVPLNGLSQSAKDRQMNNKKVRPPKNLNLVEGDPVDDMKSQRKSRQMETFPNEHFLSSQIKEVNGMDYSNHSIEQHYRNWHSRSESPEISEDSTNSSSVTNSSMQSSSQEEACVPNANSSTGAESFITESDLLANGVKNSREYTSNNHDYDPNFFDLEELDDAVHNCRLSKNAAIMGLLRQNMISIGDLALESKETFSDDDVGDVQFSLSDKNGEILQDKIGENKSDSESSRSAGCPQLVPHPDDPELYTHPLLSGGKLDDAGIDFRLARLGVKTVMTPKQYFINEALNDDKFMFQKAATAAAPKPKLKISLPKISSSRSSSDKNDCDEEPITNSYDTLVNDENDGFRLNRNDFPTLHR